MTGTVPDGKTSRLSVLVDGRVMRDSYHGIGRYAFELLWELRRREVDLVILYQPAGGRLRVEELIADPAVRAVPSRVPVASPRSQWVLTRAIRKFRPDVVFIPYHLTTPVLRCGTPVVSVVHDCIFERDAEASGHSAFSIAYGLATRLAVRSATAVATPSRAARDDIQRFYGIDLPPGAVLPHGVGARFFTAAGSPRPSDANLPGRYILHVGAQRPHKNQRVLVEALSALRADHPDLGLVLVGQPDRRFPDEVGLLIESLHLGDRVLRYSEADDETLLGLYANAAVFAYPSLAEGFGLPVLEAMAAGLAVVASDADAVQEVAAGGALIVPAGVSVRWAQALGRVLSDAALAQELRYRAGEVAGRNSWARAADRTLAVLTSATRGSTAVGAGHV
jgi:glycosyltransferase involved in cell wall biosynthesis